jgi:hypothetical protein
MKIIFCCASERSGTKYLSYLFKNNIKGCISKHEPIPTMFGKPIYWYYSGQNDKIKKIFLKKVKKINRYNANVYVETNHAFLKSFSDVAMEYFPDMKLIHLIRSPIKMAKSALNRYKQVRKFRYPYRYKGENGKKYIKWTLTGEEQIFKDYNCDWNDVYQLTDDNKIFQIILLHWIEIENRAIAFKNKYNKNKDCFILESPKNLNEENVIIDMFNFFDLELKHKNISFSGRKNKGLKPTVISEIEKNQLKEIVKKLPSKYLQIFHKKPYTDFDWSYLFSSN